MAERIWNKGQIVELLLTNNLAVERAILALYKRQTRDEQESKETVHSNGIGFSGAHANLGSYYARWILSGRHLTGSHLQKARNMTLKYLNQLFDEAIKNQESDTSLVA